MRKQGRCWRLQEGMGAGQPAERDWVMGRLVSYARGYTLRKQRAGKSPDRTIGSATQRLAPSWHFLLLPLPAAIRAYLAFVKYMFQKWLHKFWNIQTRYFSNCNKKKSFRFSVSHNVLEAAWVRLNYLPPPVKRGHPVRALISWSWMHSFPFICPRASLLVPTVPK